MSFIYFLKCDIPLGVPKQIQFLYLLLHHKLSPNSVTSHNNVTCYVTLCLGNVSELRLDAAAASVVLAGVLSAMQLVPDVA